jgi:hypothetical protein
MTIEICNKQLHYVLQDKTYLFNAKQLVELVWKNSTYYYKKWLKQLDNNLIDIGELDKYCTAESFVKFWYDNMPTASGQSDHYEEFHNNWVSIANIKYEEPPIETVPKVELDTLLSELTLMDSKVKDISKEYEEYRASVELKAKTNTVLRDTLSHPELPLYAQLTTTIVLTFFTWTVFAHYFNFGVFSEYRIFHYVISLMAAIAFEFGLLVFTVRRDNFWLHVSLFFQFIILGVHSGLLKFEYDSFEDFSIKLILTSLLPLTNKAFSATIFKN